MVVAFVDESGNDNNSAVFVMAGILLCDVASWYFANDWTTMLNGFGVSEYHASDFHGRRGDFKGWGDAKAADFEECAVNLCLKWEVKHGAVGVPRDDFKRSFEDTGFHKRLRPAVSKWKKPYLQGFQHMVADLRKYADHQPKGVYIRPIFDRCQEFMGQAQQDYNDINRDGKLGRMYVSDTREFVQLQAADFLAWEYRVDMVLERRPVEPSGTRHAGSFAYPIVSRSRLMIADMRCQSSVSSRSRLRPVSSCRLSTAKPLRVREFDCLWVAATLHGLNALSKVFKVIERPDLGLKHMAHKSTHDSTWRAVARGQLFFGSGIERSLIEVKDVLRDLLDALCDAVPVDGAERIQGLEHHQIERALEDFGPGFHGEFSWKRPQK